MDDPAYESASPSMTAALAALRRFFGFDRFLDNQHEVVARILNGEDLCVVMPTGAGKSLCYQLPALMRPGYALVVSPLISLMKDQVDALRERGIAAACINSAVDFGEQQTILREATDGTVKLLYVAPERFQTSSFQHLLERSAPSMLVVDEAHCISQWGHDFRPSYRRIGEFAERFAIGQLCAFTATATAQVRDDIRVQLHRPEMKLQVAGFRRPNLAFSVLECPRQEDKERMLGKLLERRCPTIVYTSTRKAVDDLASRFECIPYHAGMSDEARNTAQERFMRDACPVLVATNAFGMGIDRPDVRRVIHWNMPGSLEAYYQEAGRAGRDGEPAECILLFSYRDRFVQEFLIEMNHPPPELVGSLWRLLRHLAERNNGEPLEMSAADLLPLLAGAKNETVVGSALGVLEQAGAVERVRGTGRGRLRLLGDPDALAAEHAGEATQRSRLLSRLIRQTGGRLREFQDFTLSELSAIAGLNEDQVRRVLRALDGTALEWQAPFAGRGIRVLHPEETEPPVDFAESERRYRFELARLEEVIGYTRERNCRQRSLIGYFGEDPGDWRCGSCDLCASRTSLAALRREPTAAELGTIRIILAAAEQFHGRIGGGKLSAVLAGSRRPEIVERGLDRRRCFGQLSELKQNRILEWVRTLEQAGLLGRTGSPEYPCLEVTAAGAEVLAGAVAPVLSLPDAPAPASRAGRRAAAPDAEALPDGADALLAALRQRRMELARRRGVPAYVIMTDAALREFARMQPQTADQALLIKGIGPAKLHGIVPEFLQVVAAWRDGRKEA